MRKRLQTRRLAADTLRRAVGRDQFGMLRLKGLQTLKKLVEFKIRYLRRVRLVIKIAVPVDLGTKLFDLFLIYFLWLIKIIIS